MDPAMLALLTQMANQSTQMTAATSILASTSLPKKPSRPFPKWDGDMATFHVYQTKITDYKNDPFFSTNTDWSKTTPINTQQSRQIASDMNSTLAPKHLFQFTNKPEFNQKGIEMLTAFLASINPDTPINQLILVQQLADFDQKPNESGSEYCHRARELIQHLQNVDIPTIVFLFALNGLDRTRHNSILDSFSNGDEVLAKADIRKLEALTTNNDTFSKRP